MMSPLRLLHPEDAAVLVPLHARAFAPPEAWGAVAIRTMLEMPGAFGLALEAAPAGGVRDGRGSVASVSAVLSAEPDAAPAGPPLGPGAAMPAGFVLARVASDEAELLTVAVDPAHRRQGLGAALVAGAAAAALLRGAETLFLEVSEHNAAARALYAACGFHEVGRRRRYYADGSDALVLRLDLRAAAG